MYRNMFLCFFALIIPISSSAAEKGNLGFAVDLVIEMNIFSAKIHEITITEVVSDSPAEKAGVKVGQKVLSIDGCAIPGCPARKAKKLMDKSPGDILIVEIEKLDGTHELINIHVS
jgi:C-terminal processing protease CtpA/Prc